MTKTFNIFIIGVLLISSALANTTVYQCVQDGDLCITNNCCEKFKEIDSCCASDNEEKIAPQSVCCNEVQLVQNFIFNDTIQSKIPAVNLDSPHPDILDYSIEPINLALSMIIRGPPHAQADVKPANAPLFIKNCSFLC